MNELQDAAYWMACAHLPKWTTEKINKLLIDILHTRKLSLAEFFQLSPEAWRQEFALAPADCDALTLAHTELPNYAFLAEKLDLEGFELIPINGAKYSHTLKNNLKLKHAPPLLYVKGNTQLLHESSVAIVGSRNASETALEFTRTIARQCAKRYEVVVSGFAKGVDKTALDATLEAYGQSIIVLPQGILTFGSGIRKYYSQIVEGNVLVVSTYHPNVPWNVGLAMGRNVYIYGLADTIYVAESDSQGGTWAGVMDGLRKQRTIYVRQPEPDEHNANALLIEHGAIPVNTHGEPLEILPPQPTSSPEIPIAFDEQLKALLTGKSLTAQQIKDQLALELDVRQLARLLSQKGFLVAKTVKKTKQFSVISDQPQQGQLW